MTDTLDVKMGHLDDNDMREYRPIETARYRIDTDRWGLEHTRPNHEIRIEDGVDQDLLQRYDALHFWFSEADCDEGERPEPRTPGEMMGKAMAQNVMNNDTLRLTMGRAPDWKDIRDRTTIAYGHGLGDKEEFLDAFRAYHTGGAVYIQANDTHTRTERSAYSTIYMLLDIEKKAKSIIEERLCQSFTTREALTFMAAEPDDIVSYVVDGEIARDRKWFVESKWLNEYLVQAFPCFQTNFRTLVLLDAYHRFMNNDFNINKLYRVLAMLGRVNTKVVFID